MKYNEQLFSLKSILENFLHNTLYVNLYRQKKYVIILFLIIDNGKSVYYNILIVQFLISFSFKRLQVQLTEK